LGNTRIVAKARFLVRQFIGKKVRSLDNWREVIGDDIWQQRIGDSQSRFAGKDVKNDRQHKKQLKQDWYCPECVALSIAFG
jgi:rubredoxin